VIERGRVPNPSAPDEVYITLRTAQNTGLDVGDEIVFRAYNADQTPEVLVNPWTRPAGKTITVRVVGVARDTTDAQLSQTIKLLFGTPAFAAQQGGNTTFTLIAVWLKGGPAAEPRFETELARFSRTLDAEHAPFDVVPSRADAESAHHASTAVGTGLVIFMLVAGLAGLVTLAQTVRRNLSQADDDGEVLVALGARRIDRATASVVGALPYLVIAPLVAVAITFVVSPLFPLGAARALEPRPGLRADPAVLILGGVAWLVVLALLTFAVAWVGAARVRSESRAPSRVRVGGVTSVRGAVPAAIGARFGLQPGRARRALRRTAFAGVIVAVMGIVGSVVFVRSLDSFTQSPERYGLTFDLALELPTGGAQPVLAQLADDRDLDAVAGRSSDVVEVEGRSVDAYAIEAVKGTISPTLRSGRLPANDNEVALGPKLLADLGLGVGDQLRIATRSRDRTMTVVGAVFTPASESSEFNGEIVMTPDALATLAPVRTVEALVRVRPGVAVAKVFDDLDARLPFAVSDESLTHAPGPVRNLEQIARLPLVLALFFALFGAAAIAQSMFLTARERRRDLAVLRGLGFRRRQVVAVLLGAAGSVAAVALVLGIPLGVLAGRIGWSAVARSLYVAPAVAIPVGLLLLLGSAVFAVSFLAALPPASFVLRRSPGSTLRTE
jgi:predicted lysophospholipase L1 biosynthesis ABC-type transport system permease subunit